MLIYNWRHGYEVYGMMCGGAELKMLWFSLDVRRMDRIRNEYISKTAQVDGWGTKRG